MNLIRHSCRKNKKISESSLIRRALLCSLFTLLMSITMFVGTSYAWFTDTASVSVKKIQAGNLNVEIQDENGNSINTLKWVDSNNNEIQDQDCILWEPGSTYNLQSIKIVNKGNLALKYKIVISGINTDSNSNNVVELNDAITWTIKLDKQTFNPDTEYKLKTNEYNVLSISGTMDGNASNDYQGLSIDNISISILATQDTVECDSNDNQYDKKATYSDIATVQVKTNNGITTTATTVKTQDVSAEIPANTAIESGVSSLQLVINKASNPVTIEIQSDEEAKTFDVEMKGLADSNTELITVTINVERNLKNLRLLHNGSDMNKKDSLAELTNDQDYYYDAESGIITFKTLKFSPFTYIYDAILISSSEELATAIQNASAGDTIRLGTGEYTIPTSDLSNLSFKGVDGTVITGTIGGSINSHKDFDSVTFEDIEFKTSNICPIFKGTNSFKDCTFTIANSEDEYAFRNAYVANAASLSIENCIFNFANANSAFHFDGDIGGSLIIKNSTVNSGYLAFGDGMIVEITDCALNGVMLMCYGSYSLTNCTFGEALNYGSLILLTNDKETNHTATLTNCEMEDGSLISAICYDYNSKDGDKIVIDGVEYLAKELEDY
jgi:predicted ribosomally synthesized peptide with SipW-like signal peptide